MSKNKPIEKLVKLGNQSTELNAKILKLDSIIYTIVGDLLLGNVRKNIYSKITHLNDQRAKLHEKILRIDIAIFELAKDKLAEQI